MKGKLLLFPFISFAESGLFNELRPIQIKKFSPPSPVVRDGLKSVLADVGFLLAGTCQRPGSIR
jgi:hypothetical protein